MAGVPVIGALLLSGLIIRDARREAESAAALGSIEDLALLAAEISGSVHQLQAERAQLSLRIGQEPDAATRAQFERTDASLRSLTTFLGKRDVRKLPARLARDLDTAQKALARLPEQRKAASVQGVETLSVLTYYNTANGSLISAVAALMELSDDGKLLRAISSLVSVLQIAETASQEHAVLANVFTRNEFAPGVYKALITLVTELADNERFFRATAALETQALFDRAVSGGFSAPTAAMRAKAIETMDDSFGVKAEDWFTLQGQKVAALNELQARLNDQVKSTALQKISATRAHLTTSAVLAGAVLLASILLAAFIARGVTRSVSSLSSTAARVREHKDYSARAEKVSHDELGVLTEAFNEMLAGIQARDSELEGHRHNLEALVAERTAELQTRNDAMRIVLDNVDEGLARIRADGTLEGETSAAFARWFGAPANDVSLARHLGGVDPELELVFRLGWEAITDDFLPWQLALEQMPRKLRVGDRHYELEYRPILKNEKLDGALLVASDVTEAMERARREAEAQERVHVFERIMHDRSGFVEFIQEADRLMDTTRNLERLGLAELMRNVHTIKGNCGIFGLHSIATLAHDLETEVAEHQLRPGPEHFAKLHAAWDKFRKYVDTLLRADAGMLELHKHELEEVITRAEERAPHELIARRLRELTFEPVERRFVRVAERARGLAQRLGKGDVAVESEANGIRLPPEPWAEFWASFVHVVRNAVDHGLDTPEERKQAGKTATGKLRLGCRVEGTDYVIELADDGRGIDWQRVAAKAAERGLPHSTHEDLVAALFADGVSTRDSAGDTSGRGIGLGAVRAAVHALGGRVEVVSGARVGTTFRFRVPQQARAGARKVA
ncbi:MAG TPA: nitrate- and nitrite sensing domain-containing protein [Polyangiales bacterium]|nr:nitrate- and nitrite sensing domain-containing protein [Polyangiales bacterium]